MRQSIAALLAVSTGILAVGGVAAQAPAKRAGPIEQAVAAPTRTPANVARDRYRHPAQTLAFFGIKPTDTVVEIWPGGGWYTEILAPMLAPRGVYYAAAPMPNGVRGVDALRGKDTALYGKIRKAAFPAKPGETGVPDGVADKVLTFRNVHNWQSGGQAQAMFDAMFRMLKPGGTLGVVDHRLPETRDAAAEQKSGYMKESSVIAYATKAGFRLAGRSAVNANPRDTADWADGVWTLPPTYARKDADRAKYAAIGESDRMTLKFVKPR